MWHGRAAQTADQYEPHGLPILPAYSRMPDLLTVSAILAPLVFSENQAEPGLLSL